MRLWNSLTPILLIVIWWLAKLSSASTTRPPIVEVDLTEKKSQVLHVLEGPQAVQVAQLRATRLHHHRPLVYRLISAPSWLSIEENSGLLLADQGVDREHVELDQGVALVRIEVVQVDRSSFFNFTIVVDDVNDERPRFGSSHYEARVVEGGRVDFLDNDNFAFDLDNGDNASFNLAILDNDQDQSFEIVPSRIHGDGRFELFLRNSSTLTLGDADVDLVLMAEDGVFVSMATVHIAVQKIEDHQQGADVNHRPEFVQPVNGEVVISELMEVDQDVLFIKARDVDHGVQGELSLSIRRQESNLFYLAKNNFEHNGEAWLRVGKSLRSRVDNFTVTIEARDAGSPSMSNVLNILVRVEDENDNAPVIMTDDGEEENVVIVHVDVHSGRDQTLYKVRARDKDKGLNGEVRFRMVDIPTKLFSMDEKTGKLSLKRPISISDPKVHSLRIEAYDLGEPRSLTSATLTLILVVEDKSKVESFFGNREQIVEFKENKEDEMVLIDCHPNDDGNDQDDCYFIVEANVRVHFILDGRRRLLRPRHGLDREERSHWTLHIANSCVHTSNVLTDLLKVRVIVVDEDDNWPTFTQDVFEVFAVMEESTENNEKLLLTLNATDPDTDSDLLLFDLEHLQHPHLFTLDKTTGHIRLRSSSSLSSSMTTSFTVGVTDPVNHRSTAQVKIHLLHIKDQIRFASALHCRQLESLEDDFTSELKSILDYIVHVDRIRSVEGVPLGNNERAKSELLVHLLNNDSVLRSEEALKLIDKHIDKLDDTLTSFKVIKVDSIANVNDTNEIYVVVDASIYYVVLVLVLSTMLVVSLLASTSLWLRQWREKRRLERRLRAANVVLTKNHSNETKVPNTNVYAPVGSNPMWMRSTAITFQMLLKEKDLKQDIEPKTKRSRPLDSLDENVLNCYQSEADDKNKTENDDDGHYNVFNDDSEPDSSERLASTEVEWHCD